MPPASRRILVGDSMSMVVQGHDSTLRVTLDEMIYHAEMVGRAVEHALVIVDMPFPSFLVGKYKAIENAGRVLKETSCQAVKLEGGVDQAEVIEALVSAGIPVMAHVGLRPQSVHRLGGYRVQRDREQLLADAKAADQAGAFRVVLECIPADIAREITAAVSIPTIGIGAGADCDGQVLVLHDLLGLTTGRRAASRQGLRRPGHDDHRRGHPLPRRSPPGRFPERRTEFPLVRMPMPSTNDQCRKGGRHETGAGSLLTAFVATFLAASAAAHGRARRTAARRRRKARRGRSSGGTNSTATSSTGRNGTFPRPSVATAGGAQRRSPWTAGAIW